MAENPKSYGLSLRDSKKVSMRVGAKRNKDGTYSVRVKQTYRDKDGTKVTKQSAKENVTSFDAAQKRVQALADGLVKAGWTLGAARTGGGRTPDFGFDSLPKPNTVQGHDKPAKPAGSKK